MFNESVHQNLQSERILITVVTFPDLPLVACFKWLIFPRLPLVACFPALSVGKVQVKRPSHGKLKLANSCWQTQVGVCERHKNRRQTRLQTVGVK